MHSGRSRASFVVVIALAAAPLASCGGPSAAPAARDYLSAWSSGDDTGAAGLTDNRQTASQMLAKMRHDLDVEKLNARLGKVTAKGSSATAAFHATARLRGLGAWDYDGRLALRRSGDRWVVHWQPSDVHPQLTAATTLHLTRTLPERAALLDGSGQPLFTDTDVVAVGIEPARVAGKETATYAALARALPMVDMARVAREVKAAAPHAFVTVITLRRGDYDKIRGLIHELPGVVFSEELRSLAPSTDFARALLGRLGEATADDLKKPGWNVRPGDFVGQGGLQEAFQTRLAGAASGKVTLVDANGVAVATLHEFPGQAGRPVRTTLDRRIQLAADTVLADVKHPAALVAVRPSDGAVLAVANAPEDSTYDRALAGRYPPGSTFKVVTAYALLGHGVTLTTPVPCPPTITIGGRPFRNFEGEASAATTFADDFAASCNTAFIGAAQRLSPKEFTDAAHGLGLGNVWHLPLPAFTGSVPPPDTKVTLAADAIGQGNVESSVLGMAMVTAAVASGTERAPVLVADPPQAKGSIDGDPLDTARAATLRSLMGLVVQRGTAANAGLPPGTAGKTGTAEFGNDNPPKTHAWFIGYRGDLAVAVLIEGGGVGGEVAAPIAAAFLRAVG